MKKQSICVLLLAAACLGGCGKTEAKDESSESIKYAKAPENTQLTDEELSKVDEAYKKIKAENNEFAKMPRDLLYPIVMENEVIFDYCIGGIRTNDCVYYHFDENRTSSDDDLEYSDYYDLRFTEEEINSYIDDITQQIQEQIDSYKLEQNDKLWDSIKSLAHWSDYDDKLHLTVEYIADVTDETTESFPCGDHAHLYADCLVME